METREFTYTPGDIVFVHGTGFFDRLIQFGQGFRFTKLQSFYNHVAIVVSDSGDLVEALASGVKQTNIEKYLQSGATASHLVKVTLSDEDRKEAVQFAMSCISEGYGWGAIVSTALCLLFGLKFSFGFDDEDICSGLVARSLEHGGKIFPRNARHMTPADLAQIYGVL